MKKATLFVHEHELPDCPVELDNRATDLQRRLLDGGNLGIFGMGGIGKTTLAKKIFNMMSRDFDYTCFLENVKDITRIPELKDTLFRRFHLKGKKLRVPLAQFSELRDKKTLIVLDDINSGQQLHVLPKLGHFLKGSCLIITSRDKNFSNSLEDCITYEVDVLNGDAAKELFCFHAGLEPVPNFLVEYVNDVVLKCAGLPLTLEVVGRHLRGHATEVKIWKETLDKLSDAEALEGKDDRVSASLRISYDSLSKEEREVFVEAATMYFGWDLEFAIDAWSAGVKYPNTSWDTLVNRSMVKLLVKEDEEERISTQRVWVHDQLRDMAGKTGDYDILFGNEQNQKSVVGSLNANQAKAKTKAVVLCDCKDTGLRLDSLLSLQGLKLLHLNRVLCEGSQRGSIWNLPVLMCTNLIRLPRYWERLCCLESICRENFSTFNIDLNNMVNLAVLGVQACVVPKHFPQALGNLTHLRRLQLVELEGLDHLPKNFGNLSRLRVLGIKSLQALKLPEEFGNLLGLEELNFRNIRSLELPKSVASLRPLVALRFQEIDGLVALPDFFGHHLQNLKIMKIIGCPLIQRLPSCFSELSKLEYLFVSHCFGLKELGETFGKLSSLRTLVLQDVAVDRLPASFGNLSALEEFILRSDSFRSFSDNFVQLASLKHLIVSSNELETLPNGFRNLESLESMEMVHCSNLDRLPEDLGSMSSLREVRFHNCSRLRSLPDSWRKPFSPELEEFRHDVKRHAGESSQRNATAERVRLVIYGCPSLNDSVLGSLNGVNVVNEGVSDRKLQLDEDNTLASPPFTGVETQLWNGYLTQGFHKSAMTVELCFGANNEISGHGEDGVGDFTCTGVRRGSRVRFSQQYVGAHSVEYFGKISDTTINGTWTKEYRLFSDRGEFHLEQQSCNSKLPGSYYRRQ